MSNVLDVFQTTAGTTVKKVEAKDGRIMHFADGDPINQQSFASYKSHTPANEFFDRGNLQDIESTDELGEPFNSRSTVPRDKIGKPGTEEYRKNVINNQWIGFLASDKTPDDPMEASDQFQEMVSELDNVDPEADNSEQQRMDIKDQYNIGGS